MSYHFVQPKETFGATSVCAFELDTSLRYGTAKTQQYSRSIESHVYALPVVDR